MNAIGGLPMILWGVCVRVVFGLHATWLVNSATHMWGSRRFHTHDHSRNNWWVALLTFGEGQANTPLVFVSIVMLTLVGGIAYLIVILIERRVLHYLPTRGVGRNI